MEMRANISLPVFCIVFSLVVYSTWEYYSKAIYLIIKMCFKFLELLTHWQGFSPLIYIPPKVGKIGWMVTANIGERRMYVWKIQLNCPMLCYK